MSRLAKSFGLSDVGLRKICVKHDIPTPKLGKRWVASAVAIGHRLANEAEKERRRTEELERRRREHARRERRLKRHDFLLNTNS
jgi:hypothetical protein